MAYSLRTFGSNEINLLCGGLHYLEPEDYPGAVELLAEAGCTEIDTARMYLEKTAEGKLGAARRELPQEVVDSMTIDTKVNPGESLSYDGVITQARTCLSELGVSSVDILYLHSPDPDNVLEESLRAANDLHREGCFRRLGLSNYPAWQLTQAYYKAKELGWVLPSVYQGMYNPLMRQVEQEILPACEMLKVRFVAYSPLAAGLLQDPWATGGPPPPNGQASGPEREGLQPRLTVDTFMRGEHSATRGRASDPEVLRRAVERAEAGCSAAGISLREAAMRWHFHHSALKPNDGIIVGLTRGEPAMVADNIETAKRAHESPLPSAVLAALDGAWEEEISGPPGYPSPE